MNVTVTRTATGRTGTFGVMTSDEDGRRLCVTCELPWRNNKHGISCIPAGVYQCTAHDSPKHPNTWEVTDVPNRSEILLHPGNTIADTEGCILVGRDFASNGPDERYSGVTYSRAAMLALRDILPDNFALTIVNTLGTVAGGS